MDRGFFSNYWSVQDVPDYFSIIKIFAMSVHFPFKIFKWFAAIMIICRYNNCGKQTIDFGPKHTQFEYGLLSMGFQDGGSETVCRA